MLAAIASAMLMAAIASASGAEPSLDPKAEEVIARTRASTATYTIYWRVSVMGAPSSPYHAWGATIRQGALLRVEDLQSRAVADCSKGTATQYSDSIGRGNFAYGKKIAERYCGIDADRRIVSTRWLAKKDGRFGSVDEVEIVDEDGTYVYQVTEDGVVVGIETTSRDRDVRVVTEAMSFERSVAAGDLFSRRSLSSSRVPKQVQSRGSRSDR